MAAKHRTLAMLAVFGRLVVYTHDVVLPACHGCCASGFAAISQPALHQQRMPACYTAMSTRPPAVPPSLPHRCSVGRHKRQLAEMCVKAVLGVADLERRDVNLDLIKVRMGAGCRGAVGAYGGLSQ